MGLFMAVTVTNSAPSTVDTAYVTFRVEPALGVNLDGLEQVAT